MRSVKRLAATIPAVFLAATACKNEPAKKAEPAPKPPPKEQPASAASKPASMPAGHSTSTQAVDLKGLFSLPKDAPEVIATLDGKNIVGKDLEAKLRTMQLELSATGLGQKLPTQKEVLNGALNRVVDERLQEILAEQMKVKVEAKDIDSWMAELDARMEANPSFKAFLLRAGKDRPQRLKDARAAVLQMGIRNKLREEIASDLAKDAQEYYQRHKKDYLERAGVQAWRIYLKAPRGMVQRDFDIVKTKALDLHKKAKKNPRKFENLAISFSEGGKGPHGGYIGYVPKGALTQKLEKQLFAAKAGTILPLHEDGSGFYIYKAGKSRKERTIPFAEVQGQIIETIYGPVVARKVEEKLKELRKARPLVIHLKELKS